MNKVASSPSKRRAVRNATIFAVTTLAAAAGWWVGYTHPGTKEGTVGPTTAAPAAARERNVIRYDADSPQGQALQVGSVEALPLPSAAAMNGRIAYNENTTARVSSPLLGRVVKLGAELGDLVRRGDVLLTIDSPELATSEADLEKAVADRKVKSLALERARKLFDGEVIARKDLETAEADVQQASAEALRARLKLRHLNSRGGENGLFALRAPIDGIVADKQVNPGLEVRPDLANPLFTITDTRRLWALVDAPEHLITDIQVGQLADIETDSLPGQHFSARIDRIGTVLDPVTRRIQVRCTVENPTGKLRPEMFVRVAFVGDGTHMAIRVSNSSLVLDGVSQFVFVERGVGEFEKRKVRVALGGGDSSFVDEGLKSGDRIVTQGALLLNAEIATNAR